MKRIKPQDLNGDTLVQCMSCKLVCSADFWLEHHPGKSGFTGGSLFQNSCPQCDSDASVEFTESQTGSWPADYLLGQLSEANKFLDHLLRDLESKRNEIGYSLDKIAWVEKTITDTELKIFKMIEGNKEEPDSGLKTKDSGLKSDKEKTDAEM